MGGRWVSRPGVRGRLSAVKVRVRFRDLEAHDLSDLDWSGGPEHVREVARTLEDSYHQDAVILGGVLGNGLLVALGAADLRDPAVGVIRMLSVHERLQSLGIGTALIGALEHRVRSAGRSTARLLVELDNPRARALYLRLGYREVAAMTDAWAVGGGRTYVAACLCLERDLSAAPGLGRQRD